MNRIVLIMASSRLNIIFFFICSFSHVSRANKEQAIETLLLADSLFRAQDITTRKKYVRLVESVRRQVYLFFFGKFFFSEWNGAYFLLDARFWRAAGSVNWLCSHPSISDARNRRRSSIG